MDKDIAEQAIRAIGAICRIALDGCNMDTCAIKAIPCILAYIEKLSGKADNLAGLAEREAAK